MSNSDIKIAVVTGSNKGLGLATVKLLLKQHPTWTVYLTARDQKRGIEAVKHLEDEFQLKATFHPLDLDNIDSIRAFKGYLIRTHPQGINVLVNNAGIMPNPRAANCTDESYKFDTKAVRDTVMTNHFGTLNVLQELFPLMTNGGRIVNISSLAAHCAVCSCTKQIQERFRQTETLDDLNAFVNDFLSVKDGDYKNAGWLDVDPSRAVDIYTVGDYLPIGFTHATIACLTSIFQKKANEDGRHLLVNAVCPGRFKTEMYPAAKRTVDEAAEFVLHVINRPGESAIGGAFLKNYIEYANWLDIDYKVSGSGD